MNSDIKFKAWGDHASHEPLKSGWSTPKGTYRIEWSKGYRLEALAIGRRNIFPRLEYALSTDRKLLGKPVMVIGEEGAGLTSFFALHHKRLGFHSHDFTTDKSSSLNEILYAKQKSGSGSLTPGKGSQAKPKPIMLAHLERLDASGEIVAQIRSMCEGFGDQTPLEIGVYFTGRDERVFDAGVYSEFSALSSVTRLPRFTADEIENLLSRHLRRPAASTPRVSGEAVALLRWTGGQPLLIQSLLSEIRSTADLGLPTLMRRLRDNPPPVVLNWQRRLAEMLEDSKDKPYYTDLANAMRDLLKGQCYPIDSDDSDLRAPLCLRPLSLAGWLSPGLSEDGAQRVWRFSELHQFWAQPVVRHPKSFLIRSGGR